MKLVRALESGLLKIMSKMGISVFQSYQGAELFTILGLSHELHRRFFSNHDSLVGGLTLEQLIDRMLQDFSTSPASLERGPSGLLHNYLYKEHPRKPAGEKHSMTLARSKIVHRLATNPGAPLASAELYNEYLKTGPDTDPISFRHLLNPR